MILLFIIVMLKIAPESRINLGEPENFQHRWGRSLKYLNDSFSGHIFHVTKKILITFILLTV